MIRNIFILKKIHYALKYAFFVRFFFIWGGGHHIAFNLKLVQVLERC